MSAYLAIARYADGSLLQAEEFAGKNDDGKTKMNDKRDGTYTCRQMSIVSMANTMYAGGDSLTSPRNMDATQMADLSVTVRADTAPEGKLWEAYFAPMDVAWAIYLWRGYHSLNPKKRYDHNWFAIYGTYGRITRMTTVAGTDTKSNSLSLVLSAYFVEWNDWDLNQRARHSWRTRAPAAKKGGKTNFEEYKPVVLSPT
jgi:hypothetical protein